jgi:predicted DNA-binding transcriptional regulator YafY
MQPSSVNASPSTETKSRSWGADRRLQFIDFRLRWEGRINRADLTEYFGVSVPQASLDIAKYTELAPNNLEYDRSSKTYVATQDFQAVFPQSSAHQYLTELLATRTGIIDASSSFLGAVPEADFVPRPGRTLDETIVAAVIKAIREKLSIHVSYQSMTSLDVSKRLLSPHSLGHDGSRWHVRAYCHNRKRFRDFVLIRILSLDGIEECSVDPVQDAQWNTYVTLILAANPDLEAPKKRVVERDYGMRNGEAELPCRQAFLLYTLKSLGLLDERPDPKVQHIYLKNRTEIQPFIDELNP